MSASREKKIRQELAAQGIPDIKEIRAEEERKQQRRANILYGSIAAVFVLVAAALLIWNSQIIQRNSTALSVDGVKYSAAEVSYYYNSAYNNVASGQYAGYVSLSNTTPLTQQVMTDMDMMFMGVSLPEGKEEMTWHEFFMDTAKSNLIAQTAIIKAAKAEGFTFTDEMKDEVQATMDTIATYAKTNGMTTSAYIKNMFGASMTAKGFEKLLTNAVLVSYFQEKHWNELTYTEDQLKSHYDENKNTFDVSDYEYIYFKTTAPSTTDADGKTVAATDAENAAAKTAAEAAAKAALARYQAGESLEEIAKDYDMASYYHQEAGAYSTSVVQTWVYDDSRVAGDKTMLDSGSAYYVVGFNSRSRNDYCPVNVRHILVKVDTSALNSEDESYDELLKLLTEASKADAEAILKEWKDGAKTAESFAELANKYSADTGSNTNGGLYTNVPKGQMVPEFDEWIYDESRKVGDTDIIFVDQEGYYTGYHIMYFDGVSDTPYWKLQVEDALRNNDYSEWYASLNSDLTAEEHSGIKYVG